MDAVSEIKARISVEDVISEYVQLKRSGRNFKGLSPFTNEKTASFIVSPEKQIWHDFSSGKGGDVFSFIMEVEGLDFKGALDLLARKAGVDLGEYSLGRNSEASDKKVKDRLFEAIEQAVKFYQVKLTKHNLSLKYLREKRGYEKQTLIDFRFGYSPSSGKALIEYLTKKGFSNTELKKAGLISSRGSTSYDMFRDRIMIPLLDAQGRAVGFTARQLTDDKDSPKYINTPATILYDKGRQLFGLSQAKEAIRKSGFVVVVEGNLDVVASYQAGVKQVVASAGTALTTYHLKLLQRFTGDVRLAFDDDRAGQEAVERIIPLAQTMGIELSIISLPFGKDPDELINKDPKLWLKTIESHKYMIDWLIDRIKETVDLETAQGKRQFTTKILTIVRQLKDPVEQEHYAQLIAEKTNSSFKTIQEKLSIKSTDNKRLKTIKYNQDESKTEREQKILEQHLLAISMKYKSIGSRLHNLPMDVFSSEAQETARFIMRYPGVSPTDSEYGKMLVLLFEEYYQHTDEEELSYQTGQLLSRLVHTYAKTKKRVLAQELTNADEKNQETLLLAIKHLDDLFVQFSK
jgi:DNA primase